jgi:hypothetical protein
VQGTPQSRQTLLAIEKMFNRSLARFGCPLHDPADEWLLVTDFKHQGCTHRKFAQH